MAGAVCAAGAVGTTAGASGATAVCGAAGTVAIVRTGGVRDVPASVTKDVTQRSYGGPT